MESDNDDRTDIRELLVRVGTKFCISDIFFNCTVSVFFAIFLSFIYFIVFVEEGWLRVGFKILAMIVCWALKWWRSLYLVVVISRDKRWGRDGIGDREYNYIKLKYWLINLWCGVFFVVCRDMG